MHQGKKLLPRCRQGPRLLQLLGEDSRRPLYRLLLLMPPLTAPENFHVFTINQVDRRPWHHRPPHRLHRVRTNRPPHP